MSNCFCFSFFLLLLLSSSSFLFFFFSSFSLFFFFSLSLSLSLSFIFFYIIPIAAADRDLPVVVLHAGAEVKKSLAACAVPCRWVPVHAWRTDARLRARAPDAALNLPAHVAAVFAASAVRVDRTMENRPAKRVGRSQRVTMRPDLRSDVPVPYVSWTTFPLLEPEARRLPPHAPDAALATAFISNCGPQRRLKLVRELVEHNVTVAYYGACPLPNVTLLSEPAGRDSDRAQFKATVMAEHDFALALENSDGPGYVTEKFFGALLAGTVPVFDGTRDIAAFSPAPEAFLYVGDYAGSTALAAALRRLAANRTAYEARRAWRTDPARWAPHFVALFDLNAVSSECRLCVHLADRRVPPAPAEPPLVAPRGQLGRLFAYVRERGTFRFRVVASAQGSVAALRAAVTAAFCAVPPTWAAHYPQRRAMAAAAGGPRLWRLYPAYASAWDSMHGPALDSDAAALAALTEHRRLEAIFV